MGRPIKHGSTDQSTRVRILDTTGVPVTDVTSATGGLSLGYQRLGAAFVTDTITDLGAANSAHADWGMIHVGNGYYRVDLPDAAFASGVNDVAVFGTATGRVVIGDVHPLVAYDPSDAVRLGLTALPNATAGGNGGLGTVDASNRIAGIQGTKTTLDALNDVAATDIVSGGPITTSGGVAQADTVLIEGVDATDQLAAADAAVVFDALLDVEAMLPQNIGLGNTKTYRLALHLVDSIDDLPTTTEITPGTISIDRCAPGGTSWTSVVSDAACSEAAGVVYYDEVFDTATGYAEGDELRITFKSQKLTVGGNDIEITDSNGRIFYSRIGQQALTAAKLGLITADTTIASVPAVADGGVIEIYQGETKRLADGTMIRLNIDGTARDLTGLTPKIGFTKLVATSGSATLEISGTLVDAGLVTQYVYFEMTSAQTAALAVDGSVVNPFSKRPDQTGYAYRWEVGATASSICPTLAKGYGSVKARGITCA